VKYVRFDALISGHNSQSSGGISGVQPCLYSEIKYTFLYAMPFLT